MRVGDLIKIKRQGSSLIGAEKFPGHIGIITEIVRSEMNDDGCSEIVEAMINSKFASFLPRYIEVLSESR